MFQSNLKAALWVACVLIAAGCSSSESVDSADGKNSGPKITNTRFQAAAKAANALETMSKGQSEAIEFFQGPDGMIGVVGYDKDNDKRFIAWATQGGEALVIGPVMYRGRNLTRFYQHQMLGEPGAQVVQQDVAKLTDEDPAKQKAPPEKNTTPQPSIKTSRTLSHAQMSRITNASAISVGNSRRHLYMFHDPFCHYCAIARRKLQPLIDSGRVTVSFIPVAALGLKSLKAGASLLSSKQAHAINQAGGQLALQPSTPKAKKRVEDNTALLGRLTSRVATPTFIMESKTTGQPHYIQGLPQDVSEMVDDIKESRS